MTPVDRPCAHEEALAVLRRRLNRDQRVILEMQHRMARNPVREFLWRKPWRARSRPDWVRPKGMPVRVWLGNLWGWVRAAHDCSDPSVGCSCHGSYRFPAEEL